MAKKINILVNTGNEETSKTIEIAADSGKKGGAERIKAVKGARYQLEDPAAKNVGPEKIRSKRVGKNLHIMLDGGGQADLIIEGYYDDEMLTDGSRGLYGRAEDGNLYEYIPEDPTVDGLPVNLAEGGKPVSQVLGGGQVGDDFALSALPIAAAALGLGGLGAAAAAAAAVGVAAVVANNNNNTQATAPTGQTGAIADSSDTGVKGDNITQNKAPSITGKATAGATVEVTLKDANGNTVGGPYTTTADSNGNYTLTVSPAINADGTYTPVIKVTNAAGTSTVNGTPFTIDTTTDGSGGLTHDAANDTGSSPTDNITNNKKPTFSGKGEPGATVKVTVDGQELSAVVDGNGNWTTPALGNELTNGSKTVTLLFTDKAGNTKTVTNSITIDNTGPAPIVSPEDPLNPPTGKTSLTFDKVTADDIVNATEGAGTVAVTGTARGDFTVGDVVTLTINNKTFTGTVNAQGVFSVNVPGSDLLADSDKTIAASVAAHDAAGNVGIISTTKAYIVDTTAPTTTVDITAISLDTGVSSTDFITNDNNGLTLSATLSAPLVSGESLSAN